MSFVADDRGGDGSVGRPSGQVHREDGRAIGGARVVLVMDVALYVIFRIFIGDEDRMLAARFGDAYATYRAAVGDLIPVPPRIQRFAFDIVIHDGRPAVFADIVLPGGRLVRHCRADAAQLQARRILGIPDGLQSLAVACTTSDGKVHHGRVRTSADGRRARR